MSNRKDYIFAPGGLNLSWAALLRDYPDGANRCFLVALDERQISVLLDLADLMKWAWLWGINYKLEQNQWLLVEQFRQETRDALMSGCDVSLLIDAVNGVAGAIEDLTGAIGGSPTGDPPVTMVSSIAGVIEAIGDIPGPADLSGVIEAIGTIPGPADLSGVETALLPLASLSTLLAPLEDLSYLQNLTYLERLELLERLNNIVAIMSICCGKTQVPSDIFIPIIFKDEEEQLNYRCRAANYIWYTLYTTCNNMSAQYVAGIALGETQESLSILSAILDLLPWGKDLAGISEKVLVFMKSLDFNLFSGLTSSLNTNKTAFVAALYGTETDKARDAAVGTLTGLNLIDYGFLYQIFPKGAARIMDNPIDFDTPPNPVVCAGGGGTPDACAGEVNEWHGSGYGTEPTWLVNGAIIMDTWHDFVFNGAGTSVNHFEFDGLYHVQIKFTSGPTQEGVSYIPGDGDCSYHSLIQPIVLNTTYICDCTDLLMQYIQAQSFSIRFSTESG